jgi:hypothetical protein
VRQYSKNKKESNFPCGTMYMRNIAVNLTWALVVPLQAYFLWEQRGRLTHRNISDFDNFTKQFYLFCHSAA